MANTTFRDNQEDPDLRLELGTHNKYLTDYVMKWRKDPQNPMSLGMEYMTNWRGMVTQPDKWCLFADTSASFCTIFGRYLPSSKWSYSCEGAGGLACTADENGRPVGADQGLSATFQGDYVGKL